MAEYRISGIWKNTSGVITHYAIHVQGQVQSTRAEKTTKATAIALVEKPGNTVITWVWNYRLAQWGDGEKVSVVGTGVNKYLRSNPDNKLTDNLDHLIDFDWIAP